MGKNVIRVFVCAVRVDDSGAEGVVTSKAPAVKAAATKGVAMTNVLGELPSWH